MNAFADAAAGLASSLRSVAGDSVVYSRAGVDSDPIVGVVDLQDYEAIDSSGLMTAIVSHDWMFRPTDMVIDAEVVEPRSGDLITRASDGAVFEVMPLPGKPVSEFADPDCVMLVVHSKKLNAS